MDFPFLYKDAKCSHGDCSNKAQFVFMIGEADIPVCKNHKEEAISDLGTNYIEVKQN